MPRVPMIKSEPIRECAESWERVELKASAVAIERTLF